MVDGYKCVTWYCVLDFTDTLCVNEMSALLCFSMHTLEQLIRRVCKCMYAVTYNCNNRSWFVCDRIVTAAEWSLQLKWWFIIVELVDMVSVTHARHDGGQCLRGTGEQSLWECVMLAMMCRQNILQVLSQTVLCLFCYLLTSHYHIGRRDDWSTARLYSSCWLQCICRM